MKRRSLFHGERLFQTLVKHLRLRAPQSWWRVLPNAVASINLHHIGVIVHMNTKMILAALALSLSLAACAKKEEAAPAEAPAATEPAPMSEAPATEAPATDPAAPTGEAAPTDSATATPPAGETTPPPAQ
jgi:hypothetical protein